MRDKEVDAVQLEGIRQWLKVDGCLERCFERLREDVGHLVLYSGDVHRREGDWTFSSRLRQDLASHELVK